MQARIEEDFARRGHSVWLYEEQAGMTVMARMREGIISEWVPVRDGEMWPEPSLFLRRDALAAILEEAEKVIPVSHATERHLKDVVGVRDRLLSLVERGADRP